MPRRRLKLPRWPFIPELPFMPAAERKAMINRLRLAVEPRFLPTLLAFGAALFVPMMLIIRTRLSGWWVGLFALLPFLICVRVYAVVLARRMRPLIEQELRTLGLCPRCGYDHRATPDPAGPRLDRCPECGTATSRTPTSKLYRRRNDWR